MHISGRLSRECCLRGEGEGRGRVYEHLCCFLAKRAHTSSAALASRYLFIYLFIMLFVCLCQCLISAWSAPAFSTSILSIVVVAIVVASPQFAIFNQFDDVLGQFWGSPQVGNDERVPRCVIIGSAPPVRWSLQGNNNFCLIIKIQKIKRKKKTQCRTRTKKASLKCDELNIPYMTVYSILL